MKKPDSVGFGEPSGGHAGEREEAADKNRAGERKPQMVQPPGLFILGQGNELIFRLPKTQNDESQ